MQAPDPSIDPSMVQRNRRKLVMLLVLFLIPPVGAWVTWQYLGSHGVGATTNTGTLIQPARPLDATGVLADAGVRGRWTYVMFAQGECDARCMDQLYITRQARLAMNKDIPRVERLLVLDAAPAPALAEHLEKEHEDLQWLVPGEGGEAFRTAFSGDGFAPDGSRFFLVDPLGNLMMFYADTGAAKGIIRDLQKLLKISQVG
jgi:hypothetical protein